MRKFEVWLIENQPGYEALGRDIKAAIAYFTVSWSIFEYRALRDGRGYERFDTFVAACVSNQADIRAFDPIFDYFRDRYTPGGRKNDEYASLLLGGDKDISDRISAALLEEDVSAQGRIKGLLLIVYCLRNNLVHGRKWEWGLADQTENLTQAIELLMRTMDAFCREPRQRF